MPSPAQFRKYFFFIFLDMYLFGKNLKNFNIKHFFYSLFFFLFFEHNIKWCATKISDKRSDYSDLSLLPSVTLYTYVESIDAAALIWISRFRVPQKLRSNSTLPMIDAPSISVSQFESSGRSCLLFSLKLCIWWNENNVQLTPNKPMHII